MLNLESICFLLIVVGSLALFYYLGWLAGRDAVYSWGKLEEEKDDER